MFRGDLFCPIRSLAFTITPIEIFFGIFKLFIRFSSVYAVLPFSFNFSENLKPSSTNLIGV